MITGMTYAGNDEITIEVRENRTPTGNTFDVRIDNPEYNGTLEKANSALEEFERHAQDPAWVAKMQQGSENRNFVADERLRLTQQVTTAQQQTGQTFRIVDTNGDKLPSHVLHLMEALIPDAVAQIQNNKPEEGELSSVIALGKDQRIISQLNSSLTTNGFEVDGPGMFLAISAEISPLEDTDVTGTPYPEGPSITDPATHSATPEEIALANGSETGTPIEGETYVRGLSIVGNTVTMTFQAPAANGRLFGAEIELDLNRADINEPLTDEAIAAIESAYDAGQGKFAAAIGRSDGTEIPYNVLGNIQKDNTAILNHASNDQMISHEPGKVVEAVEFEPDSPAQYGKITDITPELQQDPTTSSADPVFKP